MLVYKRNRGGQVPRLILCGFKNLNTDFPLLFFIFRQGGSYTTSLPRKQKFQIMAYFNKFCRNQDISRKLTDSILFASFFAFSIPRQTHKNYYHSIYFRCHVACQIECHLRYQLDVMLDVMSDVIIVVISDVKSDVMLDVMFNVGCDVGFYVVYDVV